MTIPSHNQMQPTEPLLYRVDPAAQRLGVSRSRLYELLASGVIASVKIGRSRRIPADALHKYVNGLTGATGD